MSFAPIVRRLPGVAKQLAACAACLALACPGEARAGREAPQARDGVIDLRGWDFAREGPVGLHGAWELLWGRFEDLAAEPEAKTAASGAIAVPGPWNGFRSAGLAAGAQGYASYRLTILCRESRGLALVVPTVHSAMRLYVNGRPLARQGNPGASAESARPAVARQLVALGEQACPLRLVLHVSNYSHRLGGLVRGLRLGNEERLRLQRERGMALDMVLAGGLLIAALLAALFFAARRSDPAPLWLALFCFCLAVFFTLAKEHAFEQLVVPDADWEPYRKFEALSWYLAAPLFALFLHALYPGAWQRIPVRAIVALSLAAAAAVIVLPARLHSYSVPLMQLVTLATAAWGVGVLAATGWRRASGGPLLLAGMALFYPVWALDLLGDNVALRYAMAPLGLLCTIVAPGAMLARRFARAIGAEELRSVEERERADLLGRTTRAGLLDWDLADRKVSFSPRLKEMLGHAADADTSGWDFFDLIHPEDREIVRGLFDSQLRDRDRPSAVRQHTPWDYRLRRADGSYLWVHAEAISIAGADGRTLRCMCSFFDITEHRAVEQALRDQAKFTADLFDSVPAALAMRDAEGRFLYVNRAWESYFEDRREDVVGKTLHERLSRQEADAVLAMDRRALERGPDAVETQDFEFRGRRFMQTRTVMTDGRGDVRGVLTASLETTERYAMERALRDQMELTRTLIDENPNAMYLKDTQGRYLQVNDAWLKMVGLEREQAIGRNVLELFPEAESERYHAEDMRLIAQGEGFSEMESLRTGPGGRPQWVIIRKAVLRRADGTVVGLIGTNTDITYLKRIESELADRAKFVSELVDALPISVAMRDPEGRYVLVNRTWERYFGVRREEALGRRRRELPGWQSDPARRQDADEIERLDREILGRGPDYVAEPQQTLRLGRHYLITRRAMFDSGGRPIGVLSAGLDVTERRAMEQALALERERLAMLVRSTKAGFSDWDAVRDVVTYSDRYKEMLGYPPDADTSAWPSIFERMHPEDREAARDTFRAMIRRRSRPGLQEPGAPMEYRLRRADGSYIWVHAEGIADVDESGRTRRFITSVIDVTRYREQEEALRESVRLREEVERLSRHDLKTPLNSVIAVSRLLREAGKLSPEDDELLSIVERAGYRILSMVNLSLDLFRMEQGTYQFRPHAIDLGDVARKVAADLESQAASKNVSVRVDVARPAIAHAEELLCYSMLANLLKNAIEASPEGRTVRVTLGGDDESVLAEVHNTGAIPAAMRATFFQKYATSGKSGGLGLGTYSARLMARVQGGDLTMRTSEEKGTTITVRLAASRQPVTSAAAGTPEPAASAGARPAAELPALRVLLVDDDEFNRLVLRRYLPSPPLELAVAVNGRAALDAARKDWPDLVFLDLEMPVMSGYEAARKLRELERAEGRKRAMIVAISSNDDEATIERALASGCDRYLVKPAPREALWQVLAAAGSPPAAASAAVSWPPGGKPAEPRPQDPVEMDADLKANLPAFLASRRRLLEEMPAALQTGERAQFRRLAHRLAGSFALYGFHWAAQQARSLERDAAEGEAADLAARVAAVLEHLGAVEIRFRSAGDPVQVARGG